MSYTTIRFEIEQSIATLTLNRPEVFNSLNEIMHEELKDVLFKIKNDKSIRVLVITGEGRAFCAGQDLNDRSVNSKDEKLDLGESIEKKYNPLIKSIYNLEIPVICKINGVAAGAGVGIALACDFIISVDSASFIQAFCKIGLVPDSGISYFLPRLIGMARAKELCMLGDKLSAATALEYGLISKVYPKESIDEEVSKFAIQLSKAPTYGLSLIKKELNESMGNSLDEQLEVEKNFQRLAGYSNDYKEGVAAFLEKRTPDFQGN
ncbi:MAG: enoyl-CoA hydratase [Sulfurospirillaceae bacterium]|nr:enoyl-CoA hydratase [Sulfurospirillaceae bacterium]